MRASFPALNIVEIIAAPTARALPYEGCKCMRNPGAAFTSITPPPCSSSGFSMLSHITSTPQISSPIICAAAMARAATSGWTSSVTSVAEPPVLKLALLRKITLLPLAGTESAEYPCIANLASAISSRRILVNAVAWPSLRRGSLFTISTSFRTLCMPSPIT